MAGNASTGCTRASTNEASASAPNGPSMPDLYAELELERRADAAAIKKSYKKLVLQYHPDKNPEDTAGAEERIRKINNAYETLSNPTKRSAYDCQMNAMDMHFRGMRVDTSRIIPKAQIPKSFMLCPIGHPETFLRALGQSLVFQTRADAPEMGFGEFFEAAKFELRWMPGDLHNMCRLQKLVEITSVVGRQIKVLQGLSFGLSGNVNCCDVMLSYQDEDIVALASPEYPGAFRFHSAYFSGHFLSFDPPNRASMIAARDQFAIIDFMLVDFAVSQQFKTLDEVLVHVVRDAHRACGGHQVPVQLTRVCQDQRMLNYFNSVLGGAVWDNNDFAMYFHAHDERWEYDPSMQRLRLRSPYDRLERCFRKAKKPNEVARLLLKADSKMLQQLGADTLQLVIQMLAAPPVGTAQLEKLGAASSAEHQAFKDAQVKVLMVLRDLCERDRASLGGLCSVWRLLPGFGGTSPEPTVQSLRAEVLEVVPRTVARLLQDPEAPLDFEALCSLVDIPLDWNACAQLVSKKAQQSIRGEQAETLARLRQKLSNSGAGVFGELIEALDVIVSLCPGSFDVEGAPVASCTATQLEVPSNCSATVNRPGSHTTLGTAAMRIPDGTLVELSNLVAKPENNGRQAHIKSFIDDVQKYEVVLMSGKTVKVKRDNLSIVQKKATPNAKAIDRQRSRSRR